MEALQFGNKDKAKKYDLSKIKTDGSKFVVRHFGYVELANGEKMEDPSSNRFQVYDKKTFNDMNRQPEVNGKQGKSKFQAIGLNVDVLHNPEEEQELAGGAGAGAGAGAGSGSEGLKHHTVVVSLIKAAITAEEVDQLIVDDTRASVLKAAEEKKQELAGGAQ